MAEPSAKLIDMRQLASAQRVIDVKPIPGADNIEVVTIQGWHCVTKKNEVAPGDLAVYIQIDSICPAKEPFLFLEDRKYRIKTIKLRKQVSQGLCMPLSYFPQLKDVTEGQDLTEQLGITKYDPEAAKEAQQARQIKYNPVREFFMQFAWFRRIHRMLFPDARRGWPEFIHKTDEERIQNMPGVLTEYADKEFYATEKLDGQSASYFVTRTKGFLGKDVTTFGVCSRNIYLKTKHKCSWWDVADIYDIENKLRSVGKNICIQGEIIGPEIQENKYELCKYEFYVFNVFDIDTQEQYPFHEMVKFCESLKLNIVPLLQFDSRLPRDVDSIVEAAIAKSLINPKIQREGVVWRTMHNMMNGLPVSFKTINPLFLLKYD